MAKRSWLALVAAGVMFAAAAGQTPQGPVPPGADDRREIEKKLTELASRIKVLEERKADPTLVADVAIYRKAVEYILRFPEEFATKAFTADTIHVHDTGLARARELEAGAPS